MKTATTTINWPEVKAKDEKLVKASEDLAKLRWTYTLGQTPKVSFARYARETGVGEDAVRRYAMAYEIQRSALDSPTDDPRGPEALPIDRALNRASYSAERADVIEAVADARGIKVATVRGTGHMTEVRQVEQIAREKADKNGTTVKEEAVKLTESMAKGRASSEAKAQGRAGSLTTLVFLGCFGDARRRIRDAYAEWERHGKRPLTDEEAEVFTGNIEALLTEVAVVKASVLEQISDGDIEALLGE